MKYIIAFKRETDNRAMASFECEGTYHDAIAFGNKKRQEVQLQGETLIMSIVPIYLF